MRQLCVVTFVVVSGLAISHPTLAQHYDPAQLDAMERLSFLIGDWRGTGWAAMGPEQRVTFNQTEAVRPDLGGSILRIEGRGAEGDPSGPDDRLSHHALAVMLYDTASETFRMHSYKDGRFLDVELEVTDHGFAWGLPLPDGQAQLRFRMELNDQGQWHETGEYSPDGERWYPNLSMTLDRVPD